MANALRFVVCAALLTACNLVQETGSSTSAQDTGGSTSEDAASTGTTQDVVPTPGGASTTRCLERLRSVASATETLRDCILIVEPLPIGPVWRLLFVPAYLGLPAAIPLDSIPIAVQSAEPSLYPEVRPFELTITTRDGEARQLVAVSEDTVAVAPGDTINIHAPVDAFDAQLYYQTLLGGDGLPVMQAQFESFSSSWLLTDAVDEPTYGVQEVTWEVPVDASGDMYGYYLLSDTRSIVWGWLRFEVAGAAGS